MLYNRYLMEKNKDMKRRSTFAVLFYINRTKIRKDGLCQLLCKVSIDAEAAQIGTKVAVELVKNAVKGIGQKPLTLLALFREHNEEFRKRIGIDRTKETYGCYVRSYNHLREFVQRKCGQEDITLRSLDREFYDAFDLFLRTERRLQQIADASGGRIVIGRVGTQVKNESGTNKGIKM